MTSAKKGNHTMRTKLGGLALVLTIAATATGCDGSSKDTTPSPASDSPPSTSATPQDPRSQAKADAQAMLTKYFTVSGLVGQNPRTPLSRLKLVATSTLLFAMQHEFSRWRSSGWRQVGSLKVTKTQLQTVSLDNSDPAKGKAPYVTLMVCTDAGGVDVVDKAGKSVVLSTRPRFLTTQYTVTNYHWKTSRTNGWRVASGTDKAVGKCTL